MYDFFSGQELITEWRISRKPFILASLRIIWYSIVIWITFGFLSFFLKSSRDVLLVNNISLIINLYFWAVSIIFTIRRLHDLEMNGWYYLFLLIPFVNVILWFYLLCVKGTEWVNKFGIDPLGNLEQNPQKRGKGLIIMLILLSVLSVIWSFILGIWLYTFLLHGARDTTRVGDLWALKQWIDQYHFDTNKYPLLIDTSLSTYIPYIPTDSKDGQKNERCTYGYKYEPIKSTTGAICGYHLSACMELEKNEKKGKITENSECK